MTPHRHRSFSRKSKASAWGQSRESKLDYAADIGDWVRFPHGTRGPHAFGLRLNEMVGASVHWTVSLS